MQPAPTESSPAALARQAPREPGVYIMRDAAGTVVYVGKAKELRKRLASYFRPGARHGPKVAALVASAAGLEWRVVRSETEALLLEGALIKRWRPRWNVLLRDDKQFLQIRVDLDDPLPRFRLVRARTSESARYFGPFPHAPQVRRTLREIRRRFGVLGPDATPERLPDGSWRLYADARAEIQDHPVEVTEAAYRERVEAACAALEGRVKEWTDSLARDMEAAAEARDYEKAAECRDLLRALRATTERARRFLREDAPPRAAAAAAGAAAALGEALGLPPPATLECFDISHISGTLAVASMVRFADGRPDKAGYRRFRIASFVGNDDFRAMREVVGRRYARLAREGRPMPDLVVIDGGLGQVDAALRAFADAGLAPPPLIGLAKREETVVRADGSELRLPRHHEGLRLLQRLRDEAHRFANNFNAELRGRKLRESLLDEVEGLGPSRKAALLARFGSIQALRRATPEALAETPGVGPQLAARVAGLLARRA